MKTPHFLQCFKRSLGRTETWYIGNGLSDLEDSFDTKNVSVRGIFRLQIARILYKVGFADNGLLSLGENTTVFTKVGQKYT